MCLFCLNRVTVIRYSKPNLPVHFSFGSASQSSPSTRGRVSRIVATARTFWTSTARKRRHRNCDNDAELYISFMSIRSRKRMCKMYKLPFELALWTESSCSACTRSPPCPAPKRPHDSRPVSCRLLTWKKGSIKLFYNLSVWRIQL